MIRNLYNYQLTNKTTKTIEEIEFKLEDVEGKIEVVGQVPVIEKQSNSKGSLFIEIDEADLNGRSTKLQIGVYSKGKLIDDLNTNFLGPVK